MHPRMAPQNRIKSLSLHTFVKVKIPCQLIQLLLPHALKESRELITASLTIRTSVKHALYADVFVQPDTPVDMILIVDAKLLP